MLRLLTGLFGAALVLPAAADVPAHGVFRSVGGVGTCVEVATTGTRDCAFGSFAVAAPPHTIGQVCVATFPAVLTVTTGAFGGREIYLYGDLHVAAGAGAFYGATDPASQQGIVANAELAYAGPICGIGVGEVLNGNFDVITMIPI